MKTLLGFPYMYYLIAGILSLGIMTLVDYFLGPDAEFLNAWVIINQLFGRDPDLGKSMVLRHLGLPGATLVMIIANLLSGAILLHLSSFIIHLFK